MFPNREQFGRPIGPMGFAVNAPHNLPLPPPPPPIHALPAQHPIHLTPPPPSNPIHAMRRRMDTNTPTTGQLWLPNLSTRATVTPSIFHPPSQGAYTPPAPHRPTPPNQTTTPQSLGFHEDAEHWDAKAKYGLKLLKRVASTPYSQSRHFRMPH